MDKLVNGRVYHKAKFLRTTCKNCGKELSHDKIMQGYKWCNKKCRSLWLQKQSKKPRKIYSPMLSNDESGVGVIIARILHITKEVSKIISPLRS